jgi:diacylglycerol kinase family enzyme
MDRRHALLTLERPGAEPEPGLFFGIAANTAPWTYFRSRPIVLTPDVSFDGTLDLVSMRRMGLMRTLWAASGMLTENGLRDTRSSRIYRDLDEFRLVAREPLPLEVDGDYIGERATARFRAVPDALQVIG